MTKRTLALPVSLLLCLVACGQPAPDTATQLATWIADLSDDAMEGRGPGTAGDVMARQYIADVMAGMGLEPAAADGGWEQPFDIVSVDATVPATWTFTSGSGDSVEFTFWDEFIAHSGVQSEQAAIEDAEVVFVGYGIQAPEYGWDDYGDADLAGKVLVMLNNDPDWDPDLFEGDRRLYYGRWTYKYESAAAQGAAGAIVIHTTPSAGYPFQVVQTSWTGPQFELPDEGEPRTQINAWLTEEASRRLFEHAGVDYDETLESARSADFRPVSLGLSTSLALTNTVTSEQTANVLGALPGSDPELADEWIVFTAHHDHLGVSPDESLEDRIYNGALDNAAGVAQVLAIASKLAAQSPGPSRSMLFALVGAEEQGLLGSEYYAAHPTVPPGKMAANINYDGGNQWGRTSDVTYIGYGKSSLDAVVEAAAAEQGRTVLPDQFPANGYFYRSDQLNFARIGVPAIYLDNGTDFIDQPEGWGREVLQAWTENIYHQVSDEYGEDWNLDGMVDDVELGLACALAISGNPELPSWNPGDEFEAARLAALAAVE
ncbi:MAG: M28 family peptidase [Acidobacteriota bacterium]|nr:M28 family peptidase [Acidobacteriota bacterium]MDE3264725.1 M28 family peptidase [Acidobacteriota bacterium]